MDSSVVTALAAISGSVVGGVTSFATTYSTQRRQGRTEQIAREIARRDQLYVRFNALAAGLLFDALDHDLEEPAKLIDLIVATGGIRLASSDAVLAAAEAVIAAILASYEQPPINPHNVLKSPERIVAPLVAFTHACRVERDRLLRSA